MIRKIKKLLALVLCLAVCFSLLPQMVPVEAQAVTQAEIDALKAKRDSIKAQRQEKSKGNESVFHAHFTFMQQR